MKARKEQIKIDPQLTVLGIGRHATANHVPLPFKKVYL